MTYFKSGKHEILHSKNSYGIIFRLTDGQFEKLKIKKEDSALSRNC